MKSRFPLLLFLLKLLSAVIAYGGEPGSIRLPASIAPVAPVAITELAAEAIFVIEADAPCLTLASRVGFVSITEESGPLRIRGLFADGTKIESRTYKAKQLWIIEALSPGEVEIIVVPVGAKDETTVIRRTLVVGGTGPRPPPKPEPTPPKPEPPPTPMPQPPEQTFGLIDVVKNSVAKNVPAQSRKVAQGLAEAYRHGADAVAKGQWTLDLVTDAEGKKRMDLVSRQSALNRTVPGYVKEVWEPVFRDIAEKLDEARRAGRLQTAKQWAAAYAELSIAFFQSYVGTAGE